MPRGERRLIQSKRYHGVRRLRRAAFVVLATLPLLVLANEELPAHRAILPLSQAAFVQDADVKCLKSALMNGNPDAGPSTFLLKAPAGCRVAFHYHTAEEQLIVIRGKVWTAMKDMQGATLTDGGIAIMPSKA
ncbi:MAG: hypothetical protein M3O06_06400, partial [Pseudomonadota bacterium]|nr:hypothetical protein [Pseudomonadota bacterium]